MLQYTSRKLTAHLLRNKIIDPSMSEIYQYGLELTLSTLLTSSTIMLIALVKDSFLFGLLYFTISIPLRVTAGGYHASTYLRCFLISNGAYLTVSSLTGYLSSLTLPYPFWLAVLAGSVYFILKNCPVRNPHHPVSATTLKKNRRITIIFLCILCCLMVSLYIIFQQSYALNFIVVTVSSVAVFILPTKGKEEQNP